MRVGVVSEIKQDEYRVALTPAGALELVSRGHEVLVETGAGDGSQFFDEDFSRVGAKIASRADVWENAELILKVKEPIADEPSLLRPGQILFTYLHLAPAPELAQALADSGAVCIAYETVLDANGRTPLLAPMSEVAGRIAPQVGAYFLEKNLGGRGILLGGVPGVKPAKVVVLGGGMVGYNSARIALGLGANVTIVDTSIDRLRYLEDVLEGRLNLIVANTLAIADLISDADLVVGAVLLPGARAPKLVTREMLQQMKKASVVVDVAIDQGGCFETSRATTHTDPVYEVDGVIHYCVTNMPGAVPITSTKALTNATMPYVLRLADHGLDALAADAMFAAGLNVASGTITNEAVAEGIGTEFVEPLEALQRLAAQPVA